MCTWNFSRSLVQLRECEKTERVEVGSSNWNHGHVAQWPFLEREGSIPSASKLGAFRLEKNVMCCCILFLCQWKKETSFFSVCRVVQIRKRELLVELTRLDRSTYPDWWYFCWKWRDRETEIRAPLQQNSILVFFITLPWCRLHKTREFEMDGVSGRFRVSGLLSSLHHFGFQEKAAMQFKFSNHFLYTDCDPQFYSSTKWIHGLLTISFSDHFTEEKTSIDAAFFVAQNRREWLLILESDVSLMTALREFHQEEPVSARSVCSLSAHSAQPCHRVLITPHHTYPCQGEGQFRNLTLQAYTWSRRSQIGSKHQSDSLPETSLGKGVESLMMTNEQFGVGEGKTKDGAQTKTVNTPRMLQLEWCAMHKFV